MHPLAAALIIWMVVGFMGSSSIGGPWGPWGRFGLCAQRRTKTSQMDSDGRCSAGDQVGWTAQERARTMRVEREVE